MHIQHPQEKIRETYDDNGIAADLAEWGSTIWCGKIGYAQNNTDEPDVEKIMKAFMAVSAMPNGREDNWDICMSVNDLSDKRASSVL